MTVIWDEFEPSLRDCRVVHISEPVAKLVEKAGRADRPVAVAVASSGAAYVIRKPANITFQSDEGQVRHASQGIGPVASLHKNNSAFSVPRGDVENDIAKESHNVGEIGQGLGKTSRGTGHDK